MEYIKLRMSLSPFIYKIIYILVILTIATYSHNLPESNFKHKNLNLNNFMCTRSYESSEEVEISKTDSHPHSKEINHTANDLDPSLSIKQRFHLNCDVKFMRISTSEFHSTSNLNSYQVGNFTLEKNGFCFNSIINGRINVSICEKNLKALILEEQSHHHQQQQHLVQENSTFVNKIVLKKCCKENEKLKVNPHASSPAEKYYCVPLQNDEPEWEPALFDSLQENNFSIHVHLGHHFNPIEPNYIIGFPNCSQVNELNNDKDIWFKILMDETVRVGLKFWFRPVWLKVESTNSGFCVDEISQSHPNRTLKLSSRSNVTLSHTNSDSHLAHHKNQILLYCKIERFDQYLFHRKLFGTLCVLASSVILILLVIYISVWDKQNLAGWAQFNIFTAIFFVFGMEGVRTLLDYNALNIEKSTSCLVIALIAQIFFFAVNTSWSVMCWDLFWTFWKLESTEKPVMQHPKRLTAYLFFSWIVPTIVVIVAFGWSYFSATNEQGNMDGIYAYAHRRCSSPIRELGFQTQGIMLVVNFLFFIFTAFLIWKHRRGINASRRTSKSQKNNWRSVKLFVKLLIVMGVATLSVPLDFFFGSEDPLSPIAVILRSIHFIPVVSILFIFGFNEKNVRLINQKYPRFGKLIGVPLCPTRMNTTDTNHSKSIQAEPHLATE